MFNNLFGKMQKGEDSTTARKNIMYHKCVHYETMHVQI